MGSERAYGATPWAGEKVELTSFDDETASRYSDDGGESETMRNFRRRGKVAAVAVGLWVVMVVALGVRMAPESVAVEELEGAGPLARSSTGATTGATTTRTKEGSEAPTRASTPPSITLITIDDAGWNDMGYQTSEPELKGATTRMDAYASAGVKLTQYYGQPSCSPSRATLMTGLWVHRLGFQDTEVSAYSNFSTPLRYSTVAERLKKSAGYETLGWGKWNIGHCAEAMLPWNRGFDYFMGYMTAAVDYRNRATGRNYTHGGHDYELMDQLEGWAAETEGELGAWRKPDDWIFENNTYDSLLYGRLAADAFTSRADSTKPVFAWVAFHGVHADNDDFQNVTDAEIEPNFDGLTRLRSSMANATRGRINFGQALFVVDYAIGLVVEAMRDSGHLGVVVVHSDNGAMPCTYGGLTADLPGSNYPLRSGKFQYFEGGIRVPAFVYAPNVLPSKTAGGVYAGLMHHVDWLPTFVVGLAGGVIEDSNAVDGLNHWDDIAQIDASSPENLALAYGVRAPAYQIGPRSEIVFDISTSTLNLTYGDSSAPVDLRLDYAQAVVAYRYQNLKLLRRHTEDTHFYDFDVQYFPNCTAMFCQMNRELYSSQETRCDFQDFLFNLTEDPREMVNLADDPEFRQVRRDLEDRAKNHFKYAFYQPLNKISRSSIAANHAFHKAGGVVAPWVSDDGSSEEDGGCKAVY